VRRGGGGWGEFWVGVWFEVLCGFLGVRGGLVCDGDVWGVL